MPVYKRVPPQSLRFPKQFRLDLGNETDLRHLGEDMRQNGQLSAIGVLPDLTVIFGFRRAQAALLVLLEMVDVKIYDQPLGKLELQRLNFSENIHRLNLSNFEKWKACEEMRRECPSWTAKDLAEYLNLDPSAVTKLLSPSKCIPAWQEALKAGTVGISDCYHASQASPEEQLELLKLKLSGVSRDTLSRAVKRSKPAPRQAAVRSSRISIPLPSGSRVVISGKAVSLSEVVDTLAECLEAARKGVRDRLDAKTWQNVMRDKSAPRPGGDHGV